MSTKSQVAQEKEWRAQDDARVLAEAEQIKRDPGRMKSAAVAATKMAAEAKKHADSMSKVAKTTVKTPAAKTSGKKK